MVPFLKLLISIIKPTTEILNIAIKNKLNANYLVLLIKNGAIVTDETLKLYEILEDGYEYEDLEEFTEAAIIGNSNQGIHIYDDKLKRWGQKYFASEETMHLLQPKN